MRLFADVNVVAPAVRALRSDGHDVVYAAERTVDPGDLALPAEALADQRVFITKDHDLGTLVFRDGASHAGVLLIDDTGRVDVETALLRQVLGQYGAALSSGAFVRAGPEGARIATLGDDP